MASLTTERFHTMHETQPRRVTYPSGLVVRQQVYHNTAETLRIKVENVVAHGGSRPLGMPVGSWCVDGTLIPAGTTGMICHESLPSREYRHESAAKAFARGMFKRYAPLAAPHPGKDGGA